jgi:PAS domain S-box-containing protein
MQPETQPQTLGRLSRYAHIPVLAVKLVGYFMAVLAVAGALGLRLGVEAWIGSGLPTYITFYPAIMVVVLLAGFGPGLLSIALSAFTAEYWILPPVGQFDIKFPIDRASLVIFCATNLFLCWVAERSRRNRHKAAAYDQEVALRDSERRFRQLFTSLNEGFYLSQILCDDSGRPCDYRYLEVNPAFERVMGLSRDQIVGKRYKELVGDSAVGWLEVFSKVALTGVPANYSFYSKTYHRHFETFAFRPAKDQFAVLVTDITERKRVVDALGER